VWLVFGCCVIGYGFFCEDSSGRKYKINWERLSCRKLPMNQYANCGTNVPKVCNLANHAKADKQKYKATQDLIQISEKIFKFIICNSDVFWGTKE